MSVSGCTKYHIFVYVETSLYVYLFLVHFFFLPKRGVLYTVISDNDTLNHGVSNL